MGKLPYICMYLSYRSTFATLSEAIRGRLLLAMLDYAATGEVPKLTGVARTLWPILQDQMDRDESNYRDKCARNRINATMGANARRKANADERCPEQAMEAKEKEKEIEKEKEMEREKEKEKENETAAEAAVGPPQFFPPSVEEVLDYCREMDLQTDARLFVDYYTGIGWRVGNKPIRDWRAVLRSWSRREEMKHGTYELEEDWLDCGTVL